MAKRQWQGGSHTVIGNGRQLWYGSVRGAGFGSVLCDGAHSASKYFIGQLWAKDATQIDLEVDGQRFHLYREGDRWVLPANGLPPAGFKQQ